MNYKYLIKVLKKEYGTAAATKPGMKTKAPARRVPMSKARASTAETSKPSEEAVGEGKKRKERVKKTTARVLGRSSIMKDSEEEEEEEDVAPAPKSQKLMGDVIKSGAAPSKPKTAPKTSAPKRSTLLVLGYTTSEIMQQHLISLREQMQSVSRCLN